MVNVSNEAVVKTKIGHSPTFSYYDPREILKACNVNFFWYNFDKLSDFRMLKLKTELTHQDVDRLNTYFRSCKRYDVCKNILGHSNIEKIKKVVDECEDKDGKFIAHVAMLKKLGVLRKNISDMLMTQNYWQSSNQLHSESHISAMESWQNHGVFAHVSTEILLRLSNNLLEAIEPFLNQALQEVTTKIQLKNHQLYHFYCACHDIIFDSYDRLKSEKMYLANAIFERLLVNIESSDASYDDVLGNHFKKRLQNGLAIESIQKPLQFMLAHPSKEMTHDKFVGLMNTLATLDPEKCTMIIKKLHASHYTITESDHMCQALINLMLSIRYNGESATSWREQILKCDDVEILIACLRQRLRYLLQNNKKASVYDRDLFLQVSFRSEVWERLEEKLIEDDMRYFLKEESLLTQELLRDLRLNRVRKSLEKENERELLALFVSGSKSDDFLTFHAKIDGMIHPSKGIRLSADLRNEFRQFIDAADNITWSEQLFGALIKANIPSALNYYAKKIFSGILHSEATQVEQYHALFEYIKSDTPIAVFGDSIVKLVSDITLYFQRVHTSMSVYTLNAIPPDMISVLSHIIFDDELIGCVDHTSAKQIAIYFKSALQYQSLIRLAQSDLELLRKGHFEHFEEDLIKRFNIIANSKSNDDTQISQTCVQLILSFKMLFESELVQSLRYMQRSQLRGYFENFIQQCNQHCQCKRLVIKRILSEMQYLVRLLKSPSKGGQLLNEKKKYQTDSIAEIGLQSNDLSQPKAIDIAA